MEQGTAYSCKTPTPGSKYTCHSILSGTRFGMDGYADTAFKISRHRT